MSFGTFGNSNKNNSTSSNNTNDNPNNDVILNDPPNDSIQALKWSPNANILACAAWDCTVCNICFLFFLSRKKTNT